MSKTKKRILATVIALAILAAGLIAVNVFAEETIAMPTKAELGYGRGMYAVYEMYKNGEITQETLDNYLYDDVADAMNQTRTNDMHLKNMTVTAAQGKSGMEGMSFKRTGSDYTEMWWWFTPQTGATTAEYLANENEYNNNFYFLFGANVTDYESAAIVYAMAPYQTFCDPDSVGYYYILADQWNSYYYSRFSWHVIFQGSITMTDFSAYLLDHSNPGSTGWKVELTETGDLENTTYQLKLSPQNGDKLRVANTQITASDLETLQLTVQMKDQNTGNTHTIPAKAVSLDTSGIYFDFYGDEWVGIQNETLQVESIELSATAGSYWIYDPYSKKNVTDLVGLKSEYPITDLAGNQIVFNSESKLEYGQLVLDRTSPSIVAMDFKPSAAYNTDATEASLEDSYLGGKTFYFYAGNGEFDVFHANTLYSPAVIFDEPIVVDEADYENIYAVLNVYDKNGNPVTTKLKRADNGYYNGEEICGKLVFENIDIEPGMYSLAGERVKIVAVVGEQYIRDTVGNFGVQNHDTVGKLTAPYTLYVDGISPSATVDTAVIRWKDTDGTYYTDYTKIQDKVTAISITVPIMVEDRTKININGQEIEVTAAGAGTTTAYLSLCNSYKGQTLDYRYTVTQSSVFPDAEDTTVQWYTGRLSGGSKSNYSAFGVGAEGSYMYLHMELSDLDSHEFSKDNGLSLSLKIEDISGNDATYSQMITGIYVDNVAPSLSIRKGNVYPKGGSATLSATVDASDVNGVASLWYAWSDTQTDDPVYTEFTGVKVSCGVEGDGEVTKYLYVKAVDTYGNYTVKMDTFTVNLTTAVSQFAITEDLTLPTNNPGITVSTPLTSTGEAVDTAAGTPVTRVTLAWKTVVNGIVGYDIYFRYFDSTVSDENPFAYGDGITWYYLRYNYASLSGDLHYGNAGAVAVEGTPGWATRYGEMDVYIASCIGGFESLGYMKGDASTYSYAFIGTVAHAPKTEDLYAVSYSTAVYDSQGNQIEVTGSKRDDQTQELTYCYYRLDQDMTGVNFTLTLNNTLISEWGLSDIDFENSYAVLVSVNEDGSILLDDNGGYVEISSRLPLDASLTQVLSVPATDKNGGKFVTGAYTWVICVAQKGGAVQFFDDCFWYILLDNAAAATENFGIRSYTNNIEVTWNGNTIQQTYENEDGSVLDYINIGVATPSEMTYGTETSNGTILENILHTINGYNAYSTGLMNSLTGQHGIAPMASFTITASISEGADYGTWLGEETLGGIAGIRFWNNASTGAGNVTYVTGSYSNNGVTGKFVFDETTGIATLTVAFYCGTREGQTTNIVDAETLAAMNPGAFAVTMGSNTICYQLVMENGTQSPVYQFEMNLVEEVPEVEVDFAYGPSYESPYMLVDTNTNPWTYSCIDLLTTEYIDVYFSNVVSAYGDLRVYYVSYVEGKSGYNAYAVHELTEDELANGYRITKGCYDYIGGAYYYAPNGYTGTRTNLNSNYGTDGFFVVTDASGNAVGVYPIDETNYGHTIAEINLQSSVYDDGNGLGSIYLPADQTVLGQYAQKVEISIDGSRPTVLNATYAYEVKNYEEEGQENEIYIADLGEVILTPGAGMVEYAINEYNNEYLQLVWPYDPSVAEGEQVEHTVEIIYTIGDFTKTETLTCTAANTKPAFAAETAIGCVNLTYNVPVNTANNGIGTKDYFLITDSSMYGKEYTVEFTDLYGNVYSQTITIGQMPGLTISYSTTDPTTEPVIVTVEYTSELYLEGETTGKTKLELTFTENGSKNICDADGNVIGLIQVSNIYKTLEVDPYIFWDYRACDIQPGNIVYGDVTAYLLDANGARIIDPATGEQAKFTFSPGGETSYTFSGCYSDRGTLVADYTVKLEVTLDMEPVETDESAPDADIVSYVTFGGKAYDAETVYRVDSGRFNADTLMDYTVFYGSNCYFDDMTEMVASLGWAESYMFHFDIRDESKVKIILRSEVYEEGITYSTKSQSIDGVNLVGRTLEIKKNTEFALYLVDEYDNVTPISFKVTTLGNEPVPNTEQVLAKDENGNYVVRVYLMPLQLVNVTDLKITNDGWHIDNNDYTTTDESVADVAELYSSYKGLYYIVCKENGTYPIYYSYVYRGVERTGTISVTVDMIDNTVASVVDSKWSHNYYEPATNQDVTWQAQLNTPVRSVSAVYRKDGEYMAISNTTLQDYGVYISYMDSKITVIFENSTAALEEAYGAISLKLTAQSNYKVSYHELPGVTNVDKTAPVLNAVVSYSDDHKTATVTITTNETAISQNANQKGTEFTFTIRENTTKTYAFVDAAGNRSSINVTVDGLVLDPLTITLMDESGNVITNPARYEAEIGEKLLVLTNRPAMVWVYGEELNAQECDGTTPVELVVSENNMGLHPTFGAEDAYGNAAAVQLEYIMPKNVTAPVLVVHRLKVSVSCNATEEEIMEKLLANILYSDDATAYDDLVVTVDYDRNSTASQRVVTYTVTDDAGNISIAQCWLRIRSGLEPEITVNDGEVQADDILYLGKVEDVTITVTFAGNLSEPYKLVYEAGNLQSWAKLKDGIYLTDGYTDEANAAYTLTGLADGWYSFALITQSMEIYYFQIYVGVVS